MRYFKLPLIVTGIVLTVVLIVGIVGVTMIFKAKISDGQKQARVERLGSGVGLGAILIIAPFWLVASARYGKARRAACTAA